MKTLANKMMQGKQLSAIKEEECDVYLLMNAVNAGIHYGFSVADFKESLLWFPCADQRQMTQEPVPHFAPVGWKLILSQGSWNNISYSHMPERCQNKLRSVKNMPRRKEREEKTLIWLL